MKEREIIIEAESIGMVIGCIMFAMFFWMVYAAHEGAAMYFSFLSLLVFLKCIADINEDLKELERKERSGLL